MKNIPIIVNVEDIPYKKGVTEDQVIDVINSITYEEFIDLNIYKELDRDELAKMFLHVHNKRNG